MKIKMIEALIVALVFAAVWMSVDDWLEERGAQHQFASALANEQKLIAESDAAKRQREDELKNLLNEIESLKAKTRTPSQVIKELPKYLPLPVPISVPLSQQGDCVGQAQCTAAAHLTAVLPDKGKNSTRSADFRYGPSHAPELTPSSVRDDASGAKIPVQDLKPLFDFVQDCRACDAELDAAHKTAVDDSMKIKTLTSERDLAVRAEKGSFWHGVRQDMIWFAFGMAGYAAIHH